MKNLAKHLSWLLFLQSASLLILGLAVLLYPAILFALVAATFIWNGIMSGVMAWRVRRARGVREVRELIEVAA
jgi:uncharacterized membrane protein HdeD (DUF308 family)